ncbi:MAG: malectin domain-containing carbohydrate-binding protein, partial [Polyangia bacterium]
SERYGNSTYTLPGLVASASYTVRLHFAELFQTATGMRTFNVAINGTTVLSNFDIFAATGAAFKATLRDFTATATSSGQIVVTLTTVKDNATIEGIEIIRP